MENPEIRRRKIKPDKQRKVDKTERERASNAPDGEGEGPPPKKRKVRKPTATEDIIDGFAILAFKTYEDLERTVEQESRQAQENESQESTGGARISGGGGSGDNKVGSNESPSKESGKSSATKSPKPKNENTPKKKYKKHATTDQENNSTVMQSDLSRCSAQSGDHGNGNGSTGAGNVLEVGMQQQQQQQQSLQQQPLTPSHPHSFSQYQQQQQQHPSEPVTVLKPHSPKKARLGKEARKNHIIKGDDGSDIGTKKSSEERKDLFGVTRKDSAGKGGVLDNLQPSQTVKLAETSTHLGNDLLCERKGKLVISGNNSASTSTSTDGLHPSVSSLASATSSAAVGTQFSNSVSSPLVGVHPPPQSHFSSHQKPSTPSRPVAIINSLPTTSSTSTSVAVSCGGSGASSGDPHGSAVPIKRDAPEAADVKLFTNGPISPSKRQVEINGHNAYSTQPVESPGDGSSHPPLSHSHATSVASSQTAFTPISQPSPKSVSSGLQPAQQQVVAPVSIPKEKFGQGRIGSQTLFTPYATTAITRVRSPLGGGPPSASSACSGSQSQSSSGTTVLQPESPKEPLVPLGSPYSVSHQHHPHHHHPQHPHNLKNNQHPHPHQANNNRIRHSSTQNNYSNLPIGGTSYPGNFTTNNTNSSKIPHSSHSTNHHPHHHHHQQQQQHHHHYPQQTHPSLKPENTPPTGSLARPQSDSSQRKDHGTLEALGGGKNRSQSSNSGARSSQSVSHHKPSHTTKDNKGTSNSSTTNKSNAAKAFGSIARLLDSPTSTSSSHSSLPSHPSPLSGRGSVPVGGQHHQHPHPQHHHQHHHHISINNSSTNTNPYSAGYSHTNNSSVSAGNTTQALQHPGKSSSAGSNSSASTIPIATIGGLPAANSNQTNSNSLSNNQTNNSLATSTSTQYCSSRSHSPRGHSPTRERDSYSSNVSSLSRSSVTPVSSSQHSSHLQLPPNLSPQLQSSSYSKAASWLSTVQGLSPVPRPTPPPAAPQLVHPSVSAGGNLSIQQSSVNSPFGGYPGVSPHGLSSPHPAAPNMFAPPILPLSSISSHPASQPPAFGPGSDPLFPGPSSSDIVRRDLENRLISERGGGPSPFLTRPSDMHPHHALLPPLSGVGHLPPHTPGAPPTGPPPPHSALFPPPLFKDLPKVGIDSSFYRTNMGISYPGFNGILPPPSLTTPFAPPTQLPQYTQKKSGKWNAMHVRIAWEIYQHQQKGGSGEGGKAGNASSSSSASSSSKTVPPSSAIGAGNVAGLSTPPVSASSSGPPTSLTADLLRSSNHAFSGLARPGEAPPFTAPILSPHAPPPHASPRGTPYDPALFLSSPASHLGPPIPRYPGFGALGPSFGGLSGLGSSLLGRDLSSLVALQNPGQDQWARFPTRHPFPGASSALGANWQVPRQDQRDSKTPTETRRQKDIDVERTSRRSESRERERESRGRDSSPFRDRSPVRPARTPLENGDGDSRSSRSNDSHSNSTSAVHSSHSKSSGGRSKDDGSASNGERDKTSTPVMSSYERETRERMAAEKAAAPHPSRMYPPSSPLNVPISSAWDTFPGFLGPGPRMGLSLLQLSERERELARLQPHHAAAALRPGLFSNGPYGGIPLGVLGGGSPLSSVPPGASPAASSTSKGSPLGGPIPLLNAGIPPSPVPHSHSHTHLHSSQQQNGPNSPSAGSSKHQNQSEEKQIVVPPSPHGSRSKEDSHQSR